jgi:hypothetical protein
MEPDPAPDPAPDVLIFVTDLQEGTFTSSFKNKSHNLDPQY